MHITCIYNNQLFLLAQENIKTRLVLLVAFRRTQVSCPLHYNGSSKSLHFLVTLLSVLMLAKKELSL